MKSESDAIFNHSLRTLLTGFPPNADLLLGPKMESWEFFKVLGWR